MVLDECIATPADEDVDPGRDGAVDSVGPPGA